MKLLRIDLETYSSVDLIKSGVFAYVESPDFEILLLGYAVNEEPAKVVDLASGEKIPEKLLTAIIGDEYLKTAFNANFEITCLSKYLGVVLSQNSWACTAVLGLTLGLPASLGDVATTLSFAEDRQKITAGKQLISYFCKPCKPTIVNGGRTRNCPEHALAKWQEFKNYCARDVEVERGIWNKLCLYKPNSKEQKLWVLDQRINNRGIAVDKELVNRAIECSAIISESTLHEMKIITGLENPNSTVQLKNWLELKLNRSIVGLAKDDVKTLLEQELPATVKKVLLLKKQIAKTSVKKYAAMLTTLCLDNRIRGILKFYGANRTGRWAGKLVQVHNLPQNHLDTLDTARSLLRLGHYDMLAMLYDNVADVLSQLIRTALVAKENHRFIVADFSSIEARVIAWLADEKWRQDIFATTGKIYEASAATMFGVPMELIKKGNPEYVLRQKGKVAELACGYGGSVPALRSMGADKMGLSDEELEEIIRKWRKASPNIVKFWKTVERLAKQAITEKRSINYKHGLAFSYQSGILFIKLPSGRKLAYFRSCIKPNKFNQPAIFYDGASPKSKKWSQQSTYGGKLVENIVQAVARDCLAETMLSLDNTGYKIVMHVHDEVIIEAENGKGSLDEVIQIMKQNVPWNNGLILNADGYETEYYRKD